MAPSPSFTDRPLPRFLPERLETLHPELLQLLASLADVGYHFASITGQGLVEDALLDLDYAFQVRGHLKRFAGSALFIYAGIARLAREDLDEIKRRSRNRQGRGFTDIVPV